jgi:hypothetical protein
MINRITLFILLFLSHQHLAAIYFEVPLDSTECAEDLKELKKRIIDTHTNPYIYCTREEFDAAFELAQNSIHHGIARGEFVRILGKTLRVMRDSHSGLNYRSLIENYGEAGGLFLDLRIWSVNGELIIKEDYDKVLPKGAVLDRINGKHAKVIYNEIADLSLFEGASITSFIRITDAIYHQFIGISIDVKKRNEIEYHMPGDSISKKVVYPGRSIKFIRKRQEKREEKVYDLELLKGGKAILKIGSFDYGSGRKYDRFLKQSFDEIRNANISHLVIDLRNNTGGRANRIKQLLAYLVNDSIIIPTNIIGKQSEASKERFDKSFGRMARFYIRTFTSKNSDARQYLQLAEIPVGMIDTLYFTSPETPQKKRAFKGKTSLAINGLSASASVNFAAFFKTRNMGQLVGEPCMGPMDGTWGNATAVQLEHSKIGIILSSIRFNTNDNFTISARPIVPDVLIQESALDIQNKVDPVKEWLLKQ